jgi:hypothetical protein
MNDLEDLVRAELRARVAAAESAQEGEPPAVLLGELDRRIRRVWIRRRWTVSALSAIAFAAAVALPLALLSPGPAASNPLVTRSPRAAVPLTDTAATPPGWAPVAYRGAQISVPGSWYVETRGGSACGGGAHGMVFLGEGPRQRVFRAMGCRLSANVVIIRAAPSARTTERHHLQASVNGNTVALLPESHGTRGYLAPHLGVMLTARGPMSRQVLATLTRSPLSVVFARGPASPAPPGWRWRDFGGIRFAAPSGWHVERDKWWGGCSFGIAARTVRLSTATRLSAPSCVPFVPTAQSLAARQGVVIGAGPWAVRHALQGEATSCRSRHGMRLCILAPGGGSAVLTLLAYPGGTGRRALVQIGLAGTGATARTIFDSIRPR